MIKELQSIHIGNRLIGGQSSCYIIAEIGVNFNGELELALQTIDAAVKCGADAVKFQTFNTDEFVADKNLEYTYTLLSGKKITETQYNMFKRLELPYEWHSILKNHAESRGIDFLSSVADKNAVNLLDSLDVKFFKLASEDLINEPLLEYVAKKGRLTILSTGMADEAEIDQAINIFHMVNCPVVLLHCTSSYPTSPTSCNLQRILSLKERYKVPVGFSDHTEGWHAAMLSVGYGVCIIEKHFTLSQELVGPDHKISADAKILSELIANVRLAESMRGKKHLSYDTVEINSRTNFRRSIVAKRKILAGEKIDMDMFAYKRPGNGLKPYQTKQVVGRRATKIILKDALVTLDNTEVI